MIARSPKCLARIKKNGKEKFCGRDAKYNDLCKCHDKKFQSIIFVGSQFE